MPQSKTPEQDVTTPTEPLSGAIPPNATRPSSALAWLAFFISILSLAAVGWMMYQSQIHKVSQQSALVTDLSQIGSSVSILGERLTQLQQRESQWVSEADAELARLTQQTALDTNFAAINDQLIQIQNQLDAVQARLAEGARDLRLDDVEALLRAADISVAVLGNGQNALRALTLADDLLVAIDAPQYRPLRQTIRESAEALSGAEQVDVEALSARLQSLAQTIDSLPLFSEARVQTPEPEKAPGEAQVIGFWSEFANDVAQFLQIKVQRVDQPPQPLLAPEERYFIALNLALMLNKSELAVLQNRAMVYIDSLSQAQRWVESYYDLPNPAVGAFMQELESLKQITLTQELPSVVSAYAQFQSIRNGQN